jgi:hypothetical protein
MMRLIEWFLRLIGMGHLVRLNRDVNRLVNTVERGNYNAATAQAASMTNAQQQGAYGGQPQPQQGWQQPQQPGQPQQLTAAQSAQIQNAMMGGMQHWQQKGDAAVAANPQLVAPIEGVTIEQYAQVSAAAAANQNPGAFAQVLAQHGMDQAKYDRVAAGWQARMRDDTSFALSQIYGRAFGGAGQGQFGAAGAAGAGALGGMAQSGQVQGAGGAEPCSWDKYNEIGGAQRAWAQSGKDVNAMLKQQFGISAIDWSNMSQYWMARMMSEPQKMMDMNTLQEQWAAKYASPKADQDLKF